MARKKTSSTTSTQYNKVLKMAEYGAGITMSLSLPNPIQPEQLRAQIELNQAILEKYNEVTGQ